MHTPTKQTLVTLLDEWINQRPGLDPANYGFPAYSHESWINARRITRQLHDARQLLRAVELSSITAEDLLKAFHAFSGRLQVQENEKGLYLDYCAAACAVLASALWDYHRPDYDNDPKPGDSLRKMFKRVFGKGLAARWLD